MKKATIIYKENSKPLFDLFISEAQSTEEVRVKIALRLEVEPETLILSFKLPNNSFVLTTSSVVRHRE